MIEGETNRCVFSLAPVVGANTITGTPTIECDGLTFSGTSVTGTTVSTKVSGGSANTDYIVKITAALSSGETKVGAIRLEWKAAGYDSRSAA
jgi:hypothetical protein